MDTKTCPICCEVRGKHCSLHDKEYSKIIEAGRNIIWRDKNIAIIPSIGALNETHVLLVPLRHVPSISCLSFLEQKSLLLAKLFIESLDDGMVYFEHGTGTKYFDNSGASITHAHLHAIVTGHDETILEKLLNDYGAKVVEDDFLFTNCKNSEYNYIFYRALNKKSYFISCAKVPSQFLRKELAMTMSLNDWNWRISPSMSIVNAVIEHYKGDKI